VIPVPEALRLARTVESIDWAPLRGVVGPALQLDSGPPTGSIAEYMHEEARFRITDTLDPERYKKLVKQAQLTAQQHSATYEQLSKLVLPKLP
jgi:hypothetical protein